MVPVRNRERWCPHEVWTLAKLSEGDMTGPSSPDYIVKPLVRYSPKPRLFFKADGTGSDLESGPWTEKLSWGRHGGVIPGRLKKRRGMTVEEERGGAGGQVDC